MFIVQPNATDEEVQSVVQAIEAMITQDGGAIVTREIMGKRRLAYEVKKFTEGVFVLLRYECLPSLIKKLESHFKLNDEIIRYLIVYFDAKTLRLEEEQKKRTALAIARAGAEGRRRDEDGDEDDRPQRRGPRRRREQDDDEEEAV
jgi:small subunit ribosomal protein S6